MTARSFLRALKWRTDHLQGYIGTDDSGRWNAEWSTLLHRHLIAHGWDADDVPFEDTQTQWTTEMLRAAIWTVQPGEFDAIELPDTVQLPQSDRVPPDDGSGMSLREPECWSLDAPATPAPAPAPAMVPNVIPWPGGGGQFGGGGSSSTSTHRPTPRAPAPGPIVTTSSRMPWPEIAGAGFLMSGLVGLVVAVRWKRRA